MHLTRSETPETPPNSAGNALTLPEMPKNPSKTHDAPHLVHLRPRGFSVCANWLAGKILPYVNDFLHASLNVSSIYFQLRNEFNRPPFSRSLQKTKTTYCDKTSSHKKSHRKTKTSHNLDGNLFNMVYQLRITCGTALDTRPPGHPQNTHCMEDTLPMVFPYFLPDRRYRIHTEVAIAHIWFTSIS